MAESVTGEGASAPSPLPFTCAECDTACAPADWCAECENCDDHCGCIDSVSLVTDTSNEACAWCESTEDVQPRNGEALCIDCRASIDFMNILSTQGEV